MNAVGQILNPIIPIILSRKCSICDENSQELEHPCPTALLITYEEASFLGWLPPLSMTCFGRHYTFHVSLLS